MSNKLRTDLTIAGVGVGTTRKKIRRSIEVEVVQVDVARVEIVRRVRSINIGTAAKRVVETRRGISIKNTISKASTTKRNKYLPNNCLPSGSHNKGQKNLTKTQ